MQSRFFNKFKRITYSTSYLPEIDGLRFLAIFSVVIIMHVTHYIDNEFYDNQLIQKTYWKNFLIEGGNGVALFFVISGFILTLPFAKWRLNHEKKIDLKKYFLRRVTRLEPPYIIALIIFFIAQVWVLHKYSFDQLLPHFFASAAYLHTVIYHSFSYILPVAWSLEVEVQFYILAPLFCLVFLIRSQITRQITLTVIIIFSAIYWYDDWKAVHVFRYAHFFVCGLLLADLYCTKTIIITNQSLSFASGIVSLLGFLFIPSLSTMTGYLAKIACIFFLVHIVLTNIYMKRIFSANLLVIIGGMCYSIYLLHFAVISFVGKLLMRSGINLTNPYYVPFLVILFTGAVLFVSAIYFLLIEKAFMRPIGLGTAGTVKN